MSSTREHSEPDPERKTATVTTSARARGVDRKKAKPPSKPSRRRNRGGEVRTVMVRRLDPWSVLKLSLIFYTCVLAVVMLALMVFWSLVNQMGLVERIVDFLADIQLGVTIDGAMLARAIFLIGLVNVILWTGINVFLAFLYNLVAELFGGFRMGLADQD